MVSSRYGKRYRLERHPSLFTRVSKKVRFRWQGSGQGVRNDLLPLGGEEHETVARLDATILSQRDWAILVLKNKMSRAENSKGGDKRQGSISLYQISMLRGSAKWVHNDSHREPWKRPRLV